MGDGIGERLQFLVCRFELGSAFVNALFESLVEPADLFFRLLALGNVGPDGECARHFCVGVDSGTTRTNQQIGLPSLVQDKSILATEPEAIAAMSSP